MHDSGEDRDPFAREIESSFDAGNEVVRVDYIPASVNGAEGRASSTEPPLYEYVIRAGRITGGRVWQLVKLGCDAPELDPCIIIRRIADHAGEESNGADRGSDPSTPSADVATTILPANENDLTAPDFMVRVIANAAVRFPDFAPYAEVLIRDCLTDRRARVGKRLADAGLDMDDFRDACKTALSAPTRDLLSAATLLRAHAIAQAGRSQAEIARAFGRDTQTLRRTCRRRLGCSFGEFIEMSPCDAAQLVMTRIGIREGRKEGRKEGREGRRSLKRTRTPVAATPS